MRIWAFPSFYPFDHPGLRWNGIFAHRQYKGMIANGADLKVIQPIPWYPIAPFSSLHPEWKKYSKISYPQKRTYDGTQVFHPRIANMRPNRLMKRTYAERYVDCIVNFFKQQHLVLNRETDIFYSQWLPDAALVQLAAHKLGVRSAILAIGDDVVEWPHKSKGAFEFFTKTIEEADLRFVCADYLGKEINKLMGKELPYHVTMMGVEYDLFKPVPDQEKLQLKKQKSIPNDKPVILMVGTANERKGWLDLFDALALLKKQNKDFYVAGVHAGSKELDLNVEADKRGLSKNFLNLGEVPPGSLNTVYNIADIFCLPSHSEGMANVVIEAMSSGLPVVTTSVGGHAEIVHDGSNGILIPPQKVDVLAETLLRLMENEDLRKQLGNNARDFIVNEWGDFKYNAAKLYKTLSGKN